ncbi:unnamed protein product [Urochloa humidicola]
MNSVDVEEGEVIPAATYEPSKDNDNEESETSGDFASQVHQTFGGKETESKIWHFSCTLHEDQAGTSDPTATKSSVLITEIGEGCTKNKHQDYNMMRSLEPCELNLQELSNPVEAIKAQRVERRWSERIQKKVAKDKVKKGEGNKKRLHGGLYKEDFQGKLLEGVQVLLSCAHKVMARNGNQARLALPPAEADQETENQE